MITPSTERRRQSHAARRSSAPSDAVAAGLTATLETLDGVEFPATALGSISWVEMLQTRGAKPCAQAG